MVDRIIIVQPINLLEKEVPQRNFSQKSNIISQNSDNSILSQTFKPKNKNLVSKILFPFENDRRKADKYIENYSAIKPEINENLRKFIKSSHNSNPKRNLSANDSKEMRNSPKRSSRTAFDHPNSLHFSILNQFLNANERKLAVFFGKKEMNITSISRIVDRNATKNYLPINVNKFRKSMIPAGHANGFLEEKKLGYMKKIDEYWKAQRHDEAKLDRIFDNILKKKWEVEEIEQVVKGKIENKGDLPSKLIDKKEEFWQKYRDAEKYYERFDGLKERFSERHREKIREYFHEKLELKKTIKGNLSDEVVKERLKDRNYEEFQKKLTKIKMEKKVQERKIAKFNEVPLRNRSSLSLYEKVQ